MHTAKETEVQWAEKQRLTCDSDAPQVGSSRSDSARVVKVNRRKNRPYCIFPSTSAFLYDDDDG
jgi:hypothetical protein